MESKLLDKELVIRDAFLEQARLCQDFGSPFTARVIRAFERILDRDTSVGEKILRWPGTPDALHDALPLRVSAALHAIARSGCNSDLAAVYPPNPEVSDDELERVLARAVVSNDSQIADWLNFAPQTNEVSRSACLFLGLSMVAAWTGLPIRIFEIGSSAGLNLNLDRYGYSFAGRRFGDVNSKVQLAPEWEGSSNLGRDPEIVARRGCDVSPLYVSDHADRDRLQAYIWPDQQLRQERISRALEIALKFPPALDKSNAGEWVVGNVGLSIDPGVATVLMHSITWGYLSEKDQAAIDTHMHRIGAMATPERPLAWVRFELEEQVQPVLSLQMWPHGKKQILALTDPHCKRIRWQI